MSKKSASGAEKARARGRAATIFITIICLLLALYITASIYTPWTGALGAQVSLWLLSHCGGAVVILLFFVIYLCIARLFSLTVPHLFRQTAGTALLFVLASMLLGLGEITNGTGRASYKWLDAGSFGDALANGVFTEVGAIGTLLCGLIMLYITLILYNIPILPNIKLPIFSFKRSAGNKSDDKKSSPMPSNDVPSDAPNIAECESASGYFNVAEEYPLEEEEDTEPSDRAPDACVLPSDDPIIQDPEFNLVEAAGRIKQGVFPPPIGIFGPEESREGEMNEDKAHPLGEKIIRALDEFGIDASLAEILVGPTVIQFRLQLAPGIKVSRVASLANDIALATAVPSLRIEAPIPGKPYVGIEIPNPRRRGIPLRTIIESSAYEDTDASLPLPFGVAVNGDSVVVGLEDLPHMLIAGTTGSGKSVFVNACIVGLCSKRKPDELRMILVDPKRVEMAIYDRLPHLLTPPVTDTNKAVHVLAWAVREMEKRYTSFAKARVRNLEGFNDKALPKDRLPHIVIVVDELADLMMTAPKDVEGYICRLAQMARATGIHLMLATQRPSVNVITGLIKANIPARVAFTLPSNADSRTIIDCAGAEKLLGKGDMLFLSTKYPKPVRMQSPWVDEPVLAEWLNYLENLFGAPDFIDIDEQGEGGADKSMACDDDMLEPAIEMVMTTGIASASGLQRRLRVGFSRASRLIDMMEQLGIVGPADGARPREILTDEDGARELLEAARGGNDD